MNLLYVLLTTYLTLSQSSLSQNIINQCPQPTETNPDPPSFVYAHPDDCRYYFTCAQDKPKLRTCKPSDRARYSEFYHTCVGLNTVFDTCTRSNAQRECKRGLPGLIGHPTLCHRYFNCSQALEKRYANFGVYEDECPHPQLFDIETRSCTSSKDASCGPHRALPKDICDYAKAHCTDGYCQPCPMKHPSCAKLEDGFHPYPGTDWTKFYISCHKGKLIERLKCDKHEQTGTIAFFSSVKKKCVSRWEIPRKTGYGLAPSCKGKLLGVYRTSERSDVYFSCPAGDVFYCESGTVFNKDSYLCELPVDT